MNPVKMALVLFAFIVALLAIMIFGSLGLAKFVHFVGWPSDVLAFAAIGFVFLAGMNLVAWRMWDLLFKP